MRIYIYNHSFSGVSVRSFSVSTSVPDSRNNWISRSKRFVRAPSSGGGSNASCPAVSVPHLTGIGCVGQARQARNAHILCILGGIRPSYSWILAYAEIERKKYFGKLSFPCWQIFQIYLLLISSPPHLFLGHISKGLAFCAHRTTDCCFVGFRHRNPRLQSLVQAFVVFEGGRSQPNNNITPLILHPKEIQLVFCSPRL